MLKLDVFSAVGHPLCGTGVISFIDMISKPMFWTARIAVSRPDP